MATRKTGENQRKNREKQDANLIPFVKGDKRINRKGRPKTIKELRSLIQTLLNEGMRDDPSVTRLETMLRQMMISKSPANNKTVLEYGYGKVPDETKVTGDATQPIVFRVIYDDRGTGIPGTPTEQRTPQETKGIHPEQGETESDSGGETRG